jgi:glycosyltransferase involved in cell wall biosynthesis
MIARNMPKIVSNYALSMEKKLIKYVDQIITVNEPLYDYFKSISDKQVEIIMNCKRLINREYQSGKNKVFTILYIGVLHKSRMFPELVDIVGNIENVRFVIAGKKENLYEEVKKRSMKYDNVEFLGSIPFNQVIPKTLESDAVICMIDPKDKNNRIAAANKQFEAMVCGRPIICTKGTYSGDLTKKEKCGLVIDFNKEDFRKAITQLKNSPSFCEEFGRNALNVAINRYNWEIEEKKLIKLYEEVKMIV